MKHIVPPPLFLRGGGELLGWRSKGVPGQGFLKRGYKTGEGPDDLRRRELKDLTPKFPSTRNLFPKSMK